MSGDAEGAAPLPQLNAVSTGHCHQGGDNGVSGCPHCHRACPACYQGERVSVRPAVPVPCRRSVPATVESALGDKDTGTCEGDRVSRLVLGTRACGGCCIHGAPLAPWVLVLLWVSPGQLSPHQCCRGCCRRGAALLCLVPRVPGSAYGWCQCPGVGCPEGAGNLLVGGSGWVLGVCRCRYWCAVPGWVLGTCRHWVLVLVLVGHTRCWGLARGVCQWGG